MTTNLAHARAWGREKTMAERGIEPIRVAQFGAYDMPWLRHANDALWSALAQNLTAAGLAGVPKALDRLRDMEEVWVASDLLLAQTCGYPLATALAGRVRLVSTPLYETPFRDGGDYRSAIVVPAPAPWTRLEQLRGKVVAINAQNSNSGMNLLRAAVAPLAGGRHFFAAARLTGSHLGSLAAVAKGEADVAAIDGVTMALTARHRPDFLRGVRVLATTPAAPALPLITRADAPDGEVDLVRAGLDRLIDDPALADARATLGLLGFHHAEVEAYDRILALEREAAALGYPRLT